jgi:hypothetical protein
MSLFLLPVLHRCGNWFAIRTVPLDTFGIIAVDSVEKTGV